MKKIVPTLMLLLLLFCIVFSTTAQSHNNGHSIFNSLYKPSVNKMNLPSNRAAFIFDKNSGNSMYNNPAVAVLDAKNNYNNLKNQQTEITSVTSLMDNTSTTITEEDICMFSNFTQDELWIKLNEQLKLQEEINIEIYNEHGIRVYNTMFKDKLHKINLCDLMAGTFLVKLGDNVQKIIIE